MASPFIHTMRSLENDPIRRTYLHFLAAVAVLGAWGVWMTTARIAVYASATTGRLEVSRMVHRVAAQEAGRIAALHLELGSVVQAGDLLVELDTTVEEAQLASRLVDLNASAPKIEALRREIVAEEEASGWQGKVNVASLDRARVDLREAELNAAHQEQLRGISRRLHDEKLASQIDLMNASNDAADKALRARGAKADVRRLAVSSKYDARRAVAHIADLERQLAELEGATKAAEAAVTQTRAEIERRKIRAPAAGKLGNIDALQVGDVVSVGAVVATVVPSDDVHVVAEFDPSDAVGRILPGQPARVRLNGFSWAQFGMLDARVEHLASEPRDGTIRVELLLLRARSGIPIQHGLPGSVEVEVERVAPWALLLRGLGAAVAGNGNAPPPAADAGAKGTT